MKGGGMADKCRHCLRPKAERYEEFDDAHCMRSDERCKVVAPYERELAGVKAQLSQATATITELRLEVARLKLATPGGQDALREEILAYDFMKEGG
jgi:hypothetical protein